MNIMISLELVHHMYLLPLVSHIEVINILDVVLEESPGSNTEYLWIDLAGGQVHPDIKLQDRINHYFWEIRISDVIH